MTFSTTRLDRILRDIPDHRRRYATPGARVRDAERPAVTFDQGAVNAANHTPVGGLRSIADYQRIQDEHYERQRLQGERRPAVGDHLAGLRDAALWSLSRG